MSRHHKTFAPRAKRFEAENFHEEEEKKYEPITNQDARISLTNTEVTQITYAPFKNRAFNKIERGLSRMQFSENGLHVLALHQALNELGYKAPESGSLFWNKTRTELMRFQSDHGIKASGTLDSGTLLKMDEVLGKSGDQEDNKRTGATSQKKQTTLLPAADPPDGTVKLSVGIVPMSIKSNQEFFEFLDIEVFGKIVDRKWDIGTYSYKNYIGKEVSCTVSIATLKKQLGITDEQWARIYQKESPTKPSPGELRKSIKNFITTRKDEEKGAETLSPVKRQFIKDTLSTANSIQNMRILDLLKQLSDVEIADYQSKVSQETTDLKVIETSLRYYIENRNNREKEKNNREELQQKLGIAGLEALYKQYSNYIKFKRSHENTFYEPKDRNKIYFQNALDKQLEELQESLKANGFTLESFKKLITDYELSFRKKTVHIAEDALMKYKHVLFEGKSKLFDDAFLTKLLKKIKASKAKKAYEESEKTRPVFFDKFSNSEDKSFRAKMEVRAANKKAEGSEAIKGLSSVIPLVEDNGFDKENFASIETKQQLRYFLEKYISDQEINITKIITDLHTDESLSIYGYTSLLEKSKEQQGITKDSIFDLIITDKQSAENTKHLVEGLLIGVLAVALGLLTFGTGTVAVLLAAGNFALSAYMTYEEIEAYRTQLAAYHVNISEDEPSAVWLIISVVGSVLDAAAVANISSKLVNAGRAFERSKDITEVRKLLTETNLHPAIQEKVLKAIESELVRVEALENKIQQNFAKQTELKTEIKESLNKAKKNAFTANIFVNPEFATKLPQIANKYIKSGKLGFENFLLELQAEKIIKELNVLSSEELSLLRKTFEEAKSLVQEDKNTPNFEKILGDNDTFTMREIIKNAGDIHAQNTIRGLTIKGIEQDIIDNIIIRCKYIDIELGNARMSEIIDKLANSPGFKNAEDLSDVLRIAFKKPKLSGKTIHESAEVIPESAKNLLNEFETGLRELNDGSEVIISKVIGGDEIDVLNITRKKIIESKRVIGSDAQVKENIKSIIGKFNTETRLSTTNKELYPNHFGQIKIDNPNNSYFNLNKQQFIDKIRQDLFPYTSTEGGIEKIKLQKAIQELEVTNGQGTFKISKDEW